MISVVHVTASLTSQGGGVREMVFRLSKGQVSSGLIKCTVVGLIDDAFEHERHEWTDVPIFAEPVSGIRGFGYSKTLYDRLVQINPDMIHLHGLWMYPGFAVLKWHKMTGKPFVISTHGMVSKVALSFSKWKKKAVSILFQDELFRLARAVHATCEAEVDEIHQFGYSGKVELIPNGVVVPDLYCVNEPNIKSVMTLGRIHKKKGLSSLLLAWSILQPKFPDWNLEIVGPDEGNELSRLKSMVSQLKLSKVSFEDAVYGDSKWEKYRSASIFVLPSLSENFAITVAESLACAVPVVSTKGAPWEGLQVHNCGKWVDIDAVSLATGLESLMSMSGLDRKLLGLNGRVWMEQSFSWNLIANDFISLYKSILMRD